MVGNFDAAVAGMDRPGAGIPVPRHRAPVPGQRAPVPGQASSLAPGVLRQGDTWLGELELARQEAHSDGCSDDPATLQARKRLEPRCFRAWS